MQLKPTFIFAAIATAIFTNCSAFADEVTIIRYQGNQTLTFMALSGNGKDAMTNCKQQIKTLNDQFNARQGIVLEAGCVESRETGSIVGEIKFIK